MVILLQFLMSPFPLLFIPPFTPLINPLCSIINTVSIITPPMKPVNTIATIVPAVNQTFISSLIVLTVLTMLMPLIMISMMEWSMRGTMQIIMSKR